MKKAIFAVVFALVACLPAYADGSGFGAQPVRADEETTTHTTFEVGELIPASSVGTNSLGPRVLYLGADTDLPGLSSVTFKFDGVADVVFADHDGSAATTALSTFLGIGAEEVFESPDDTTVDTTAPYIGAAIGASLNGAAVQTTKTTNSATANFAWKIYTGIRYKHSLSIELMYLDPGEVGSINLAGYGFNVGYRF